MNLMDINSRKKCWVCGAPSDSREHIFKRSDLVRRYGKIPFKQIGGIVHFKKDKLKHVPSSKSKIVSYEQIICESCNNKRFQPWDRAYEMFEKWIFNNSGMIFDGRIISLELIYGEEHLSSNMSNLYKYFVKTFGCRLASIDTPIPKDIIESLSQENPSSKLRLSFAINKTTFAMLPEDRENFLGVGDLIRMDSKSKGTLERYEWCLNLGWLRVCFFYDMDIPLGLGTPWASDSKCLYLGEFEIFTLDELIENAKKDNLPVLSHLETLKETGGIEIK